MRSRLGGLINVYFKINALKASDLLQEVNKTLTSEDYFAKH